MNLIWGDEMNIKILMNALSWIGMAGGIATAIYGGYALVVGEIVVSSRLAGTSVYHLNNQPGPFFVFVGFYFLCAVIFFFAGYASRCKGG